jgi:hypothetical protein
VQSAARPEAGTSENICSPQGAPEARRIPGHAYLPAVQGLPLIDASTRIPNFSSLEPDAWMRTPLLRRPSDPISNRTKLLIASASAALLTGYFVFSSSDRSEDVAVTATDISPVAFLSAREATAPSAEARGTAVESRTEPGVRTAPLPATARLDTKPTESGIEASPPQTLPESGKQPFAAGEYDSSCYPSASAVRQDHPRGRPSWTMRAPGHGGTRCWYAAAQTTAEAEAPSARARGITVQSRAEPEVQTASPQPGVRPDIKPTEIEARPPQTLPEGRKQLFESGHDFSCYPSASDVRQNHPRARPSWTMRAPGHEGARCWYAAARTTAGDRRGDMAPGKETAGTTEKPGSPGTLFGVFGVQ